MEMTCQLKDILDLDYLLNLDDDLERKDTLCSCRLRDRDIYQQIDKEGLTEKELIWAWFKIRKEQVVKESAGSDVPALPGTLFSRVYRWMMLIMIFLGAGTGFLLATSFLVYHGSQPVNVTVFFVFFVMLPMLLTVLSFIGLGFRTFSGNPESQGSALLAFQKLVQGIFFDLLPRLFKRMDGVIFPSAADSFENGPWPARLKMREYQALFFWPFFLLTSLFAALFSTGVLGATFFKVLVSDMAFGWQSTLVTSAAAVHDLVSLIATPWSFFVPETFAFPNLAQIQGSRIILKEGISVLSSPDLASWWPFLCMSILVYALIPRVVFFCFGYLAQRRAIRNFEFFRPEFRQLIIRMTSPVVDIERQEGAAAETDLGHREKIKPLKTVTADIEPGRMAGFSEKTALLMASGQVYSQTALETVKKIMVQRYGVRVSQTRELNLNRVHSDDLVLNLQLDGVDPVIVLYEAWQPPIRGLLYSIARLRKVLPKSTSLWILLTGSADQADLTLAENDQTVDVWVKAVGSMDDPMIVVKRLIYS